MTIKSLEFNIIKTVGTINKDTMLIKVFKKKFGTYNYVKLKSESLANELTDETFTFIKGIFENVILQKKDLTKIYKNIEIIEKTPRRLGKIQIEKDIISQDGVASSLQIAMLNLAKLKTMTANLLDKGVSDYYKNTEKLSKTDLRVINAAIRDLEKQIRPILIKK